MKGGLVAFLLLLWLDTFSQSVQRYQVIITECMSDPLPANGLPQSEYIELKNATDQVINLSHWTISDGSTKAKIPEGVILAPDSFLIVCPKAYTGQFESYGKVAGISGFPALDNEGDLIVLASPDGNTIHAVEYRIEWYNNALKSGGGWSLEMIDTRFPCDSRKNWNFSNHPLGGTPGKTNSSQAYQPDNTAPGILRSYARDSLHIIVGFNKPIDSATGSELRRYEISNGIGHPIQVMVLPPLFQAAELVLKEPLIRGNTYKLEYSGIADCYGKQKSPPVAIYTGLASHDRERLILNELLFNPRPGGSDFIELFHAGNKIIDASRVFLAGRNAANQIHDPVRCSETPWLIFPGDYLVLCADTSFLLREYRVKAPEFLKGIKKLPSMPDDRGRIVLLTENGEILDEFTYSEKMHYPLLSNNEGVSLERIDPSAATQDAQNWFSAAADIGYATPTSFNSQLHRHKDEPMEIVTDQVFSPDHDGYQDLLTVSYQFPDPGTNCSISIYDRAGYPVRNLVRNQVCGTSGYFRWDGLNDRNQKLNAGIYYLVIELFRLNGKRKTIRKTVVLAYRRQ